MVAFIGGNGCREKVVTKARNVVPIPDGVSDEVAAGIPITYGTALHGLKDRAKLKPGETVAVLGAAGGAGLAAVEIAKLMGARVIAVASSGDKLAFAREHGADEGINYETEDLKARLKRSPLPKGVDVLYDTVGGAYAEPSLRAMAWEGRYLVLGFASGTIPENSAQSRHAQGLRHHRRVLDRVRRAQSGKAPRQHDRAARLVQTRAASPRISMRASP